MPGTHSGILVDYGDGRLARAMVEVSGATGRHTGGIVDLGNGKLAIAAVKTALSSGVHDRSVIDHGDGTRSRAACMVDIGSGVHTSGFIDLGNGQLARAVAFVDGSSATRSGHLYDLGSGRLAVAVTRFDTTPTEITDATYVADTFTRADGFGLGDPETGDTWVEVTGAGTWGITTNAAYSSTAGVAVAVTDATRADVSLTCTMARAASNIGVLVRTSVAGAGGYRVRGDGTNIYLENNFGGNTVLAQSALTWATRTIRVRCVGEQLEVYVDGAATPTLTALETTRQTGTYVGLYKNSAATTTHTFDNLTVTNP